MLLSLIIPAYNSSKYIVRCIESIYRQNFGLHSFEVIVIDDGSEDETKTIVDTLIADGKHKNLKIISQENSGPSVARNKGIEIAIGKYVWFIDSDDYIESGSISDLINILVTTSPDVILFELLLRNIRNRTSRRECIQKLQKNEIITGREALIKGFDPGSACSAILKKDLLLNNKILFKKDLYNEDVEFMYRTVALAQKVYITDFAPYVYELREDSRMTSTHTSVMIKRISDNAIIAQSFDEFSESFDIELRRVIKQRSKSIAFGTLLDFYRSKSFHDSSARQSVLDVFRAYRQFPLRRPFNTLRQAAVAQYLNLAYILL